MRLSDKVAIITGAGSGIGRATALLFAQEGATVVLADRDWNSGEELATAIRGQGGRATFVHTDVSKHQDVRVLVDATLKQFDHLDVLVNNAGISGAGKVLADTEEDEWDEVLDVNLKGPFLCSKHAIPHMRGRGGVIINLSSVLAYLALPRCTAYCASKAAIIGLTKALALEVARDQIRVNCIVPGSIDTPMLWEGLSDTERREVEPEVNDENPIGRIGQPEEIAKAALFLATDESSFVTGAPLIVDGGLLTKLATIR